MCDRDYYVTVCASCLTAACWHGEVMCEASHDAGSTQKLASELRRLNREHSCHFSPEKLTQVCGPILWVDGSDPSRKQQVDAAVQKRLENMRLYCVVSETFTTDGDAEWELECVFSSDQLAAAAIDKMRDFRAAENEETYFSVVERGLNKVDDV